MEAIFGVMPCLLALAAVWARRQEAPGQRARYGAALAVGALLGGAIAVLFLVTPRRGGALGVSGLLSQEAVAAPLGALIALALVLVAEDGGGGGTFG